MDTKSFYHRSESEYAYLYTEDTVHIRFRSARGDLRKVGLIYGDPYLFQKEQWNQKTTWMKKAAVTDRFDYWQLSITLPLRRLMYTFYVEDQSGVAALFGDRGVFPYNETNLKFENSYFKIPYLHEIDRTKIPDWVSETVWYQIFPERFANGDPTNDPETVEPWGKVPPTRTNFFGGDLQGIIDHLDDLADLGVNGLYLCPIFTSPTNHKYDTRDYFTVDPHFGDIHLLKHLVAAAHQKGFKVMLDAVFNHIGDASLQWQDVLKNGQHSRYADWFHIPRFPPVYQPTDDPEFARSISYHTFAFNPHMPKWNTANPEVRAYLLEIARFWVEECDIDAWRLDVANEVDHHFWRKFHEELLQIKPDFYILGEVWNSAQPWLQGEEFHGVMNYALTDSILQFFCRKEISLSKMKDQIDEQLMLYRWQVDEAMLNALDSHDTPRLLTVCGEDKALLLQILAFTYLLPGEPCVYYGTEVGMKGGADPLNRACMVWDEAEQDLTLKARIRKLIHIRRRFSALFAKGELTWQIDDERQLLKLFRRSADTAVAIFLNAGTSSVVLPREMKAIQLIDQNHCQIERDRLEIAPKGYVIFSLKN